MEKYRNRQEAGNILAQELSNYAGREDVLVLALPRGGVPVAFEIAKTLNIPLDVFIVRKLGVPGHSELAMGALAMGGTIVYNNDIIAELAISEAEIEAVIEQENRELKRREIAYRDDYPFPSLIDKTIILVDDGIATGATMRAAIQALRQLKAASIIVAVPVADTHICEKIEPLVNRLVCPLRPFNLYAVGAWYDDFAQTEDEEVYALLKEAQKFTSSKGEMHG